MNANRVGVDLAKNVFQVHGVGAKEEVVWRRQLRRGRWLEAVCERLEAGAEVGMEACAGAHHWARELQSRGYRVKLLAPQFVKPYVKSNKTDRNDAEAICEAMSRPGMRFVEVKSVAQQDVQAVHRVRSELVAQRTAKANQIRGLVAENGLSERFRRLLFGLWSDLRGLCQRVSELDDEIAAIAKSDPVAQRLQQLRGVGPVTATALAAAVGSGAQFRRGRDLAVWLGLTPRQHSTGGKARLLGISKRGDPYLRRLLVHGARAVIQYAKDRDDPLSQWVTRLAARRHVNVATVALANKTARIAWAMIRTGEDYQHERAAGLAV